MIDVQKLYKKYGNSTILSDINFSIAKGDIFGVMGRNGAGKTTLIKSILNEVKYQGDITLSSEIQKEDGRLDPESVYFVSDTPHTYGYLTGIEYLQFVLKIKNKAIPPKEKIFETLNFFGLSKDDSLRLLKDYSFGMSRKIVLATGFLAKPKLMILDEPTIGLDVPSVITLKKLILKASEQGMTFLVTSHDPSLMSELCSSLLILHDNKAVYNSSDFKSEARNLGDLYIDLIGENVDSAINSILNM